MDQNVKRRRWSDEEKRSICRQAAAAGVSVAQVARRYAMNANMIFKWQKDPRFSPGSSATTGSVFLPVEIAQQSPAVSAAPSVVSDRAGSGARIEITFAGGHRISIEGGYDPDGLARLLKGILT